jgi:hypothetical protein
LEATAEAYRSFWRQHKGPANGRAVVSRMMLAVREYSPIINDLANSPADYRWAIAFSGYNGGVKPLPAPHVPGKTEFERFDNAVRQVLTVSKAELLRREEREKPKPEAKRPKKS